MTTAVSPLRPLGMGQLLDRAIRLYRQNFLTFVGIVAIAQIPATIFSLLLTVTLTQPNLFANDDITPNVLFGAGLVGFFGGIIAYIFAQIATAALTIAVADQYLGEKIGIWEAYRRLGNRWLSLLLSLLLAVLFGIGLFVWLLIPCIGWFTGLGMMFYFSMVIIPMLVPVVVLENRRGGSAILRAWDLARRRFWPVLGFVLLLTLFQMIMTGPTLLVSFLTLGASGAGDLGDVTAVIIQQAVGLIFSTLYLPIHLTAITLLYFDVRVRSEGLDLVLLAKSDTAVADASTLTMLEEGNSGRSKPPTPDSTELGYFAVMTIGFIVLYFGLIGIIMGVAFALGSL